MIYLNKISIIFSLSIISLLNSCYHLSYSDEIKDINKKASPVKIGFAILPTEFDDYRSLMNNSTNYSNKIVKSISKFLDKQENDKLNYTYIRSLSEYELIDFSQEYRDIDKKNLILFNYETKQIGTGYGLITLLTLGIIPSKMFDLKFSITPTIFDSKGKKYVLDKIDYPLMSEWVGILVFPLRLFDDNLNYYFNFAFSEAMNKSIGYIEEKNIELNNFNDKDSYLNLPFRMKKTIMNCSSKISKGSKQYIAAPKGKKICEADILFKNLTENSLKIDSKYFFIKVNDVKIKPEDSLRLGSDTAKIERDTELPPYSEDLFHRINLLFLIDISDDDPNEIYFYNEKINKYFIKLKLNKDLKIPIFE